MLAKTYHRLWLLLGDTVFHSYYRECVVDLGLGGNEKAMDFGCGPGLVSLYFAERLPRGHLTCVDASATAIESARARLHGFSNVDFVCGDIREADLESDSYDVIFLNFVYYHIKPSSRVAVLEELARLTRPGGRLVVRTAIGGRSGLSPEKIREEMHAAGFSESRFQVVRLLRLIPTYIGVFQVY